MSKKYVPRWIIFFIDIAVSIFSMTLALLLRFNFVIQHNEYFNNLGTILLITISVRAFFFVLTKSFAGIIRHTEIRDAVKIFMVIAYSNAVYGLINLTLHILHLPYLIPNSVILIDFFIVVFLLTGFRITVKLIYNAMGYQFKSVKRIMIYGTNEIALLTQKALSGKSEEYYKVQLFISPDPEMKSKRLENVRVYPVSKIDAAFYRYGEIIDEFIFTDTDISPEIKQRIVDLSFIYEVKILTLPSVSSWINGELSHGQIRKFEIDDLLERDPIQLDDQLIQKDIHKKTILVTGAAGSIGREIILQLTNYHPKKIIAFDQAESPLHNLDLELREKVRNGADFEVVIGDITEAIRVKKLFETYKPQLVFHAAAYKHVPMMEANPFEAVRTNVLGTKIIADTAIAYDVEKFVMISTDKAVNPTNVMGASKRIAEIYTQTMQRKAKTSFITTRFGNVLGSNGSVIPRFKEQIERGGPVTVTHPDITRYFMTIPEACRLVLQAGALGKGGEIFLFDMGKSVKISDLAKKMIKLSGYELGKDILLNYTGLRPGEKLKEELLADKEKHLPTVHEKIMIAQSKQYTEEVFKEIDVLIAELDKHDNMQTVRRMKQLVPEFISQNSEFEVLDK